MKKKEVKRITIYDIAKELEISPSAVSKALNNQNSVSEKTKLLVKAKARELNYKHNSYASNLRRGSSRILGVIVPKINTAFFSDAIAGMEEACYEHNYRLIICQSDERFIKEKQAIETLIEHDVECIIISLSAETKSIEHLQEAIDHQINLIQFDRIDKRIHGYSIINDNKEAAYKAVRHLIDHGYRKIALLGGPNHLMTYHYRREGYIMAIEEAALDIPYNYLVEDAISVNRGKEVATELLQGKNPPDAFFAMSDYSALGALRATAGLGFIVPEQVGIMGFANEVFSELIAPSISSIDQNSREMGKQAANIFFNQILHPEINTNSEKTKVIRSTMIIRTSSQKDGRPR